MVETPGHVSARLLKGITARRGRLPPLPPGDSSLASGSDLGENDHPSEASQRGDRGSVTAPGTRGLLKGRQPRAGRARRPEATLVAVQGRRASYAQPGRFTG